MQEQRQGKTEDTAGYKEDKFKICVLRVPRGCFCFEISVNNKPATKDTGGECAGIVMAVAGDEGA